jgi:hypothetical protein
MARVGARASCEFWLAAFMPLTIHAPALSSGPTSSIVARVLASASSLSFSNVPHLEYSGGTGFDGEPLSVDVTVKVILQAWRRGVSFGSGSHGCARVLLDGVERDANLWSMLVSKRGCDTAHC